MDSGLKERLVGAAVLVALGVWLIPWVLDGRDPQPEPVAEQPVALPAVEPGVRVQTSTVVIGEEDREESDTAEVPSVSTMPVEQVVVADTEPEPDAVVAASSRIESIAVPTDPAPAETPVAEPPPAPVNAPGWYVQLGSFSDAENARRLAARVGTFGFEADVSAYQSAGRSLNRVRVGPADSRAEAEAVASSLGAHGFPAQVLSSD